MDAKKKRLDEARSHFMHLVEYMDTSTTNSIDEAGADDPMAGGADPTMGGAGADPTMGGAGAPMGGDPSMGGADPMGGDPSAMGGADPTGGAGAPMGGDPSMGAGADGGQGGAEGFQPQGPDATMGAGETENIGGDPNATGDGSDEEVIDVDDLTNSQEETEDKVDRLLDKFDSIDQKMFGALDKVVSAIEKSNERIDKIEANMNDRLPDPEQKMSLMRSKSKPFDTTPEKYWQTDAPNNYSAEDDNNGVGMPKYEIKQSDIDNMSDLKSVYDSLDAEDEKYGHMTLKDIYDL